MINDILRHIANKIKEQNPNLEDSRHVWQLGAYLISEDGTYSGVTDILTAGAYIRLLGPLDIQVNSTKKSSCADHYTFSGYARIVAFSFLVDNNYIVAERLRQTVIEIQNLFNDYAGLETGVKIRLNREYTEQFDIDNNELAAFKWTDGMKVGMVDVSIEYDYNYKLACEPLTIC